ncbi:MAG: acyltransferase [Rikenellaceae bacterium]
MSVSVNTKDIFSISSSGDFEAKALEIFRFQAQSCKVYKDYLNAIGVDPSDVQTLEQIPMLPIELFKSHEIYCGSKPAQIVFTSSATTGMVPSNHHVADVAIYEESFMRGFELFYGRPKDMCIYALLPNYLEREGSSLVYMFDKLIKAASSGGFYLYDTDKMLEQMASFEGPKLLLGVSYALLDLAEAGVTLPENTMVMETGGMKGRRKEMTKQELHTTLCQGLGVDSIHSEYGMAELLSQAYSSGQGVFTPSPWLDIRVRDLNDPFRWVKDGHMGGINIIDLANVYSCSFIQTQDLGTRYDNGTFSLGGRISGSDIRGCNLLVQ